MEGTKGEPILKRDEKKAIIICLLFLFLGLILVCLAEVVFRIKNSAVLTSVLVIPVLTYMVISGTLRELKGPGGFEAKFVETAVESISPALEKIEPSVEEMELVQKASIRELQDRQKKLNEVQPIVMTMVLGKDMYHYTREALLKYLMTLFQYRNFKFIVFVNGRGEFVAYMASWAFKGLLCLEELGEEFVRIVNQGNVRELIRYPGVVTKTIFTDSTNKEVLREMMKQNLEALVVIDKDRHIKGVVEREQVLSRMMLALTG